MIRALVFALVCSCGIDRLDAGDAGARNEDRAGDHYRIEDDVALILLKKRPDGITLLGGQSNIVGQGDPTEVDPLYLQAYFPVTLDQRMFLGSGPTLYTYSGPLSPRPVNHMGLELSLGRAMPTRAIAQFAQGSTSLAVDWAPGSSLRTGWYSFGHSVETLRGAKVTSVIWGQGENDSTDSTMSLAYGTNLNQLITETLAEFPDAKFYYYKIPPVSTFNANVRAGQVAAQGAKAIMIDVDDLPRVGVHFTSAGYVTLGQRFAGVISP